MNQMGHSVGRRNLPSVLDMLLNAVKKLLKSVQPVELVLLFCEISVAVGKGSQNDTGIGCLALWPSLTMMN